MFQVLGIKLHVHTEQSALQLSGRLSAIVIKDLSLKMIRAGITQILSSECDIIIIIDGEICHIIPTGMRVNSVLRDGCRIACVEWGENTKQTNDGAEQKGGIFLYLFLVVFH